MNAPDFIWTADEINILIDKYRYMSVKHIHALIPRHSLLSIYSKAHRLGLKAYKKEQDYSAFLYSNTGKMSVSELSDHMRCSRRVVYYRMKKLKIDPLFNTLTL